MSDLVGNPKDRFSRVAAQISKDRKYIMLEFWSELHVFDYLSQGDNQLTY